MKDLIAFCKTNLLTSSGRVATRRLSEKWFTENGHPTEVLNRILETNPILDPSSIVWCLTFNGSVVCKKCESYIDKVNKHTRGRGECSACIRDGWVDAKNATMIERYGVEHAMQDSTFREKATVTMLDRYGAEHPLQVDEFKEKARNTTYERFGVEHAMKSASVRDRAVNTNLQRYGTKNPMMCEDVKERQRTTVQDVYGCNNAFQADEVKEKIRQTTLVKFGVDNPSKSPVVRNRVRETVIGRYGVDHVFKDDTVKKKIELTNLERWGFTRPSQNEIVKDKIRKSREKSFLGSMDADNPCMESVVGEYENSDITISGLAKKLGVNQTTLRNYLVKNGVTIRQTQVSYEEKLLSDSISDMGVHVVRNTRVVIPPKEIDIWIPSHNLGIEYHGVYWHSDAAPKSVKTTHIEKAKLAKDAGISLLQFFSNEVEMKGDIIESIVMSRLGKNRRVYARQTEVRKITRSTYEDFCIKNHLQGYGVAKFRYGLYHGDELVSIMSFSKSRYTKDCDFEMVRYCSLIGHTVVGGASKLFKAFMRDVNPSSIVSYADARISDGGLYDTLGFSFSHWSQPNYFYTKDFITLESRIKYQKHKLKYVLDTFDSCLSESENMKANGYHRVYDAGNLVYKWKV